MNRVVIGRCFAAIATRRAKAVAAVAVRELHAAADVTRYGLPDA